MFGRALEPQSTYVFHDLLEQVGGHGINVPFVDELEEDVVELVDEGVALLHAVDADDDGADQGHDLGDDQVDQGVHYQAGFLLEIASGERTVLE